MSGGFERAKLPMSPTSHTWSSSPTVSGLVPRLPRSIDPNAPRLNLNKHWEELGAWCQKLEERRAEALVALQEGRGGSDADNVLSNWCRLADARHARATANHKKYKIIGGRGTNRMPPYQGRSEAGDRRSEARAI